MLIRFAEDKGLDFLIFTSTIVWRILSKSVVKISGGAVTLHTTVFLTADCYRQGSGPKGFVISIVKHFLREAELVENRLQEPWEVSVPTDMPGSVLNHTKTFLIVIHLRAVVQTVQVGFLLRKRGVFTFILMLQLNSRHKYFPGVHRCAVYSCIRECCSWHQQTGNQVQWLTAHSMLTPQSDSKCFIEKTKPIK